MNHARSIVVSVAVLRGSSLPFIGPSLRSYLLVSSKLLASINELILTILSSTVLLIVCYSSNEARLVSFLVALFLFASCMLAFLLVHDLTLTLASWECLGLLSCYLISYHTGRLQSNKGSIKSLTFNIIGDASLIVTILGTSAFNPLLLPSHDDHRTMNGMHLFITSLCIVVPSLTKSCLVFFHL